MLLYRTIWRYEIMDKTITITTTTKKIAIATAVALMVAYMVVANAIWIYLKLK